MLTKLRTRLLIALLLPASLLAQDCYQTSLQNGQVKYNARSYSEAIKIWQTARDNCPDLTAAQKQTLNEKISAARSALDDAKWQSALKNAKADLNGYLSAYPNGRHAREAREKLAQLEDKPFVLPEQEREAPPVPSSSYEPRMILVEGGSFSMGSSTGSGDEKPVHTVRVSSFYLADTEVTVAQYRAYCRESGAAMPKAPSWGWSEDHPIVNVSWNDAIAYCQWLSARTKKNYRLPTEAEWEYAARGGGSSKGYVYAGSANVDEVGWYSSNSGNTTHPVRQKKANELGLYDMSGNVWEWCQDWYHSDYTGAPANGSAWENPAGSRRVFRGGSWFDGAAFLRVANRNSSTPDLRDYDVGFRLSRTP